MEPIDRDRIRLAHKMAKKLARNRSKQRTVRKLAQTMVVVPGPGMKRALPIRSSINRNKRLTYIMLVGISLGAYIYDMDLGSMARLMNLVQAETQHRLPAFARAHS